MVSGSADRVGLAVGCALTRMKLQSAVLFIVVAACAEPSESPPDPFAALMDAVHESYGFSGAVVVARRGDIVFEGGWGFANQEADLRFSPDTPVDGASLAKTLVAAGLWQLQSEGRLALTDRVRDHLPSFPHEATTLGQLLDHSAGLAELDDATGLTNADVVAALGPTPLFAPGSRFSYCNECFDVLALVTERVSGQPWDTFLQERFFTPLAMDSAFVRPAMVADWDGVRTRSYRRVDGELLDHDVFDNEPFYGSSNVYFSARDLARWATAFVDGSVLGPAGFRAGREQATSASGTRSALNRLNWFQDAPGGPAYFDGHLRGFHSVAYWDPDTGVVVAWVSNVLGGRPQEHQLTRALVALAAGEPAGPLPRFDAVGVTPLVEPTAIDGAYALPGLGVVEVEWADGIALVSVAEGPLHEGYPATGFYLPTQGVEMGFTNLVGGRYQALHWLTVFDSVAGSRVGS